jgi:hypothetical protein
MSAIGPLGLACLLDPELEPECADLGLSPEPPSPNFIPIPTIRRTPCPNKPKPYVPPGAGSPPGDPQRVWVVRGGVANDSQNWLRKTDEWTETPIGPVITGASVNTSPYGNYVPLRTLAADLQNNQVGYTSLQILNTVGAVVERSPEPPSDGRSGNPYHAELFILPVSVATRIFIVQKKTDLPNI